MRRRPRIVSLLPSATEIVCALGFRERLVGRSHECDYPPDVTGLPICTAPRFQAEGTSREINDRVEDLLARALSLYEVKAEMLSRLRPDVLVTQTQCEACAVSLGDVTEAVAKLAAAQVEIVTLTARSLEGVFEDIRRVAAALNAQSQGAILIGGLKSRVTTIARRAELASERPTVACLEWLDPPMAAGTWVPELVELAGGTYVPSPAREDGAWIAWQDIERVDPDVIIAMPCGFDVERTSRELVPLLAAPKLAGLRAIKQRNVFVTDANQFFNRPGPRLVESLEICAEILHPEAFSFGHEGSAWQRLA